MTFESSAQVSPTAAEVLPDCCRAGRPMCLLRESQNEECRSNRDERRPGRSAASRSRKTPRFCSTRTVVQP